MNALSDYLMKSGREEAGVLLGAYGRNGFTMGIRKKFLLLTVVVGVLLALVSGLGYFMAYRALDASIQDEISASMEAERQKLSGWVAEHTRIAEDLAAHAAAMDEAVGKPTPGMIQFAKDDMILDITLGREDDYAIGAKDGNLTGEFFPTTRDWYKDAKAQGKTIYTDPYIDATTKKLCVSIAVPYYRADGSFSGAICEDVLLTTLDDYVSELKYKGEGKGKILSENGTVLASVDTEDNNSTFPRQISKQPLYISALRGKPVRQ